MKKTVKIIALFLSVLMCVSGLSVSVLAEPNDTPVESAGDEAVSALESSEPEASEPEASEPAVEQYTVAVTVGSGGFASVGGEPVFGGTGSTFTVNGGGALDISVVPDSGYEIDTFEIDGTAIEGDSYSFDSVSADSDVIITFKEVTDEPIESTEPVESTESTEPVEPTEYTVSVTVGNGGFAVVGDRAVFGGANAEVVVNAGDSVSFVIAPDSGYEIDVFEINGEAVEGTTYTLGDVSENVSVTITFKEVTVEPVEYTVNVTVGNGGSVMAGDRAVSGGSSCEIIVEEGGSLALGITPDEGYEIDTFEVDGTAVDGTSYTISEISANVSVNVTFKEIIPEVTEYIVRVIVGNGGSANVGGETVSGGATSNFTVEEGGNLVINFVPAEGREIDTLKVGGIVTEITNNEYTLSNVSANVTVMVTFKETVIEYNLTLSASGNGSISVGDISVKDSTSDAFAVNSKEKIVLTITPDDGYEIKSLTINGSAVNAANNSYTVNGLSKDTTVKAEFGLITYDVTFNLKGKGSIKIMEKDTSKVLGEVVNSDGKQTVSKTFELSGNIKFSITTDGTYDIVCGEPYCANIGNLWFFSPVSCDSENNIVFRNDGNSENPENPESSEDSENSENSETSGDTNNSVDHTVKVTVGGGGSVLVGEKTVNGGNGSNLLIPSGESLDITVTPDDGYELASLEINGTAVNPEEIVENKYTLTEISENVTVLVTFQTEGGEDNETLIVADDIDWTADEIVIDVNGKEVSKDVFDKIASLEPTADKYVSFVSENGCFYVPYGGASGTKAETLNMAVVPLTEGVEYNKIMAIYKGNTEEFKIYSFNFNEKDMPAGTKVSFDLDSYFGDKETELLVYTPAGLESKGALEYDESGAMTPVYYSGESILICAVVKAEEDESAMATESSDIVSVVVDESSETSDDSQSEVGGNNTVIVVLVIVLVAVLGAAALFIVKWKQEKF